MLTAPAASAAWPMENADPANLGALAQRAPADLGGAGTAPTDGKVITQVVEGPASLALAGSLGGTVYAIDARGETAWTASVPGEIRTAPAWTGEQIVVVPRADEAIALDPAGEQVWTLPIENVRSGAALVRMASPVVHPSGDVIIADLRGNVHKVNEIGNTVWSYTFGGGQAVEATPAIAPDGDVIAAAFVPGREGAGTLARIDGITGEEVWSRSIGAQVVGAPTVVGERVLVPLRDGDALTARALSDGSLEWSAPFDDHVTASPSIYEDLAIVGDIRGTLRAIEVSDGDEAWSFSPLRDDADIGSVAGGTVQTVADSVAIDRSGRVWASYWNARMATCCPPTDSGQSPVFILEAESGDRVDRADHPKASHGPSLHATGAWVGSDEGLVRHWSLPGTFLDTEAFRTGRAVTLVVNSEATGSWSIDWGQGDVDEGSGSPTAVTERVLDPGAHTITVTVGERTASVTVDIPQDASVPPDASQGSDAGGGQDTDDTPVPLWPVLAALVVVAWRRRRA